MEIVKTRKTVVSGSYDNTVRIWNVKTGEEVKVLNGHLNGVYSIALSRNGKTV